MRYLYLFFGILAQFFGMLFHRWPTTTWLEAAGFTIVAALMWLLGAWLLYRGFGIPSAASER